MLNRIADELVEGRKVILVHGNADMDAIGSAYGLMRAFAPADIYAPSGVDRVARTVCEKMEVEVLDHCDTSDYDRVVVVDTSSPEQLEIPFEIPEDAIILDHHTITGAWTGELFYCDPERTSCCEIVKDVIDAAGRTIERDMGLMLMCGMITDSGNMQYAKPPMLVAFSDLMVRCGVEMDEVLTMTEVPVSISERIAMLKCMERAKFERIGNLIVASSVGGSFEASCCRALMAAGADIAFVGSQRGETMRISSRATQEAVRKGIHLGDILRGIGMETGNDGGGHNGAAGLSGIGDVEAMLFLSMQKTMDVMREIKARESIENSR
ncbi:MAG: DHH family phosphoesterase [Candidatus Methanomethylophilaceae archaeon]|nr:DHH family phosphoesterase [Candidatus Methanomethylophilaceae archaeon]